MFNRREDTDYDEIKPFKMQSENHSKSTVVLQENRVQKVNGTPLELGPFIIEENDGDAINEEFSL